MTPALDAIRASHTSVRASVWDIPPSGGMDDYRCSLDGDRWPCDAARLLAALDRAEAVVVEWTERANRWHHNTNTMAEAARDLYSIAVGEHGHDETHSADWPSCLPAHIAMNRYRAALAEATAKETP